MPRPTPRSGYGFPSGDSGTAFSFATVIGSAFPALAPILFLLATLTSVSRLYFRAHYVWDILGGAGIGIICGKYVTSRMLPSACSWWRGWTARIVWFGTGLVAIASVLFFLLLETKIAEHKRSENLLRAASGPRMIIDFGTPAAQPYLLKGWSRNELWRDPQLSINWVEGLDASLAVSVYSSQDFRLLLHAYPYRPKGFLCQWAEVNVADRSVGRIYLEQDWNTYEIDLPKESITKGENRFDFHFRYADNSNWHGVNPDHKPLSVAFNLMELAVDPTR
jgi:PAP2 superfamily protein